MEPADKKEEEEEEVEESKALPSLLHPFAHSTACNLSNNELTSLPREFGQLTALTHCELSHNQLTALPREFGQLIALTHYFLSRNKLTSLPREFGQLTALNRYVLDGNPLAALPCSMVWLLPSLYTLSHQPFPWQEALPQQMEENEEEEQEGREEEEPQQQQQKKKRVDSKKSPPMRNRQAAVKSLWYLSGEAVLRNKLLPPGLLTPVPDPPFTWISSSSSPSSLLNEGHDKKGTKKEQTETEESVEGAAKVWVVLPEEVQERLQRSQRRCDVCAQLFLEAEGAAEEEAAEEEAEQTRQVMRRYWDQERRVWWELLCCGQSCFHRPLAAAPFPFFF